MTLQLISRVYAVEFRLLSMKSKYLISEVICENFIKWRNQLIGLLQQFDPSIVLESHYVVCEIPAVGKEGL